VVQGLQAPAVGREHELGAVRRFVKDVNGGPASLVLEGLAGIGKTAIWNQALLDARADGVAVRSCRCTESDAAWAFAGLGDLLDGLSEDVLAELPVVQQRALSGALLLSDAEDGPPGNRVVGVAVLGALRVLARSGPLVLAVDDVQWLDTSSRRVLSFALRRLTSEPVGLLTSCRSGPLVAASDAGDASDAADLGLSGEHLVVGPVSVGNLQRIVSTRLDQILSRPTLTRLHQATGGNPMMCLEMARALQRLGREPAADEPLPVPADLRLLVTQRLRGLTDPTRRLLLVTSALSQPTVAAVTDAVGDPE
jgi:predicted ATPase